MRVLIMGCGYVGTPLAAVLTGKGNEVVGVRRSNEDSPDDPAGLKVVQADVTDRGSLDAIGSGFDWVINAVSSSRGGAETYRQVYLEGTRNMLDWLAASGPPGRYVHLSSSSVYGQTDGTAVKESSPTEPGTETGRVLVETEQALLDAHRNTGFPAIILRLSGIYGPDRGHLFKQFLNGEARIIGDGMRHLNMIHLDDVVGAIIAAAKSGRPGEIYNVTDDEPVHEVTFFRWLAEGLGRDMPPHVKPADVGERKRGLTNKRVQNRKLKMELGYTFLHPNFRYGYTDEIKRLEDAGELS